MRGRLATIDNRRPTSAAPRPGFTLVEMLVVIGIIAVLAGVIGVVVSKARGTADKFRLAAQIRALEAGLEAYKADFAGYPVTSIVSAIAGPDLEVNRTGFRGARTLCKALMGTCSQGAVPYDDTKGNQDGAEGLGFRVLPRSGVFQIDPNDATKFAGKVYGPYLSTSQFKFAPTASVAQTVNGVNYQPGDTIAAATFDDTNVLLDLNGKPILYYALLNGQAPINVVNSYVAQNVGSYLDPTTAAAVTTYPMYRGSDNSQWLDILSFSKLLGDKTGAVVNTPDGAINANAADGETAAVRGKYILWSAGVDGLYGYNANLKDPSKTDDVTSFQE